MDGEFKTISYYFRTYSYTFKFMCSAHGISVAMSRSIRSWGCVQIMSRETMNS